MKTENQTSQLIDLKPIHESIHELFASNDQSEVLIVELLSQLNNFFIKSSDAKINSFAGSLAKLSDKTLKLLLDVIYSIIGNDSSEEVKLDGYTKQNITVAICIFSKLNFRKLSKRSVFASFLNLAYSITYGTLSRELQSKLVRGIIKAILISKTKNELLDEVASFYHSNKSIKAMLFVKLIIAESRKNKKYVGVFSNDFIEDFKSSILKPYFEDTIMVDDDVAESLKMQVNFYPCLQLFENKLLFENISSEDELLNLSNTNRLFMRNSSNFKFVENYLSFRREHQIQQSQAATLFTDLKDYFFQNKSKPISFSAIKSFNMLMKNKFEQSSVNDLLSYLLETEFIADQADINFNVSLYIISIISNQPVFESQLFSSLHFILTTLRNNYKESLKGGYEEMFNLLFKGLKLSQILKEDNNSASKDAFSDSVIKTLTESSLSNFNYRVAQILNVLLVKKIIDDSFFSAKLIQQINRLSEYCSVEVSNSLNFLHLSVNLESTDKHILCKTLDGFLENWAKISAAITEDQALVILILYFKLHSIGKYEDVEYSDTLSRIVIETFISSGFLFTSRYFCLALSSVYSSLPYNFINEFINSVVKYLFVNNKKRFELQNYSLVGLFKLIRILVESNEVNEVFSNFGDADKNKFALLVHFSNSTSKKIKTFNAGQKLLLQKIFKDYVGSESYVKLNLSLTFSQAGLYNNENPIMIKVARSIMINLVKSNPNYRESISEAMICSFNADYIENVVQIRDFLETQLNYLSYFDLKSTLEMMKDELERQGYSHSIIIEEEPEQPKKGAKDKKCTQKVITDKNKQKEQLTQSYKDQLLSIIYGSLGYLRFKLTRVKEITQYKIICLGDKVEHNEKLFKSLLNLTKYSQLRDISCQIIINLFSTDPEIRVLDRAFTNFIISAFKVTLTGTEEISSNEEEEATIKLAKQTTIKEFLEISRSINTLLYEQDKEKSHAHNRFMIKFSNILIDALFIALNEDIENENKEPGIDLMIQMLSFEIDPFVLSKLSAFLIEFLKVSYYNRNLEDLLICCYNKCESMNEEILFYKVFNNILDFNYLAKSLLVGILLKKVSRSSLFIRQYIDLAFKLFICTFDSNSSLVEECISLWNNSSVIMDLEFIASQHFVFLNHTEKILIEMSSNAINAYFHFHPLFSVGSVEKIISLIKENINKKDSEAPEDIDQEKIKEEKIQYLNILIENIHLLSRDDKLKITRFVIESAVYEDLYDVNDIYDSLIRKLMSSIEDMSLYKEILAHSEVALESLVGFVACEQSKIKNPVILLTIVNRILEKLSRSNYKGCDIIIFQCIKKLVLSTPYEEILVSCCDSIALLMFINSEVESELLKSVDKTIKQIFEDNDPQIEIGYFYLLASLLKAKGINQFYSLNLKFLIEDKANRKPDEEKVIVLRLIAILSKSLKKLFEPIFVSLFDFICLMISSREEEVRSAAMDATKAQIKYLTGYGVKTILPSLVKDLHSKNWKCKIVNVEILGHFSFCAPKQLSQFLPTVIKELLIVFKDPHTKVMETTVKVLRDISSVITNPEIVDLSDILINAFSNPFEHSKSALTSLLGTIFKHAIDPPSLALIIPIIDYNLKISNDQNKIMAAQIIGAISSLILNTEIIHPYLDILLPNLKSALFDSSPEVRNAMAKAIGSLTKSLGEKYKQEMIVWVSYFLEHEVDLVQRSGAAQAYAEIIFAFGEDNITSSLPGIIDKIGQHVNKTWKEGYLGIFVFLPGCMGERFEKYFDYVFPLIIDGFSDDTEKVRNVSNKIFEICISIFSKKNTKELVTPLLNCLFDANWRIRNSSIALIKTLITNLNKEFYKYESDYFTRELRDDILANSFILKADTFGNTATIANIIWRDYVDNIPKYLSKILHKVYDKVVILLTSKNDETLDIAEGIVNMLVVKFSDKFFMELLPLIQQSIEANKDEEVTLYSSFCILKLACSTGSSKLLSGFKDEIISIVNENVLCRFAVVRKLLAHIIYELSQKYTEQNITKKFVYDVMKTARTLDEELIDQILVIVISLVEISKGEILQVVLAEVFRKPYEGKFFDVIHKIADSIVDLSDTAHLKDIYNNLALAFEFVPKESAKAIVSISIKLKEEFIPLFIESIEKIKNKVEKPREQYEVLLNTSEAISQYLKKSEQDLNPNCRKIMEFVCSFLSYDIYNEANALTNSVDLLEKNHLDELLVSLNSSIKSITEKVNKESLNQISEVFLDRLNEVICQYTREDNAINGNTKLERLNTKLSILVESLIVLIDKSLSYGQDQKTACRIIELIIKNLSSQNLKPYLVKLSENIIRVLIDNIGIDCKEIVLDALNDFITKIKGDLKPLVPQLRTILTKSLIESTITNSDLEPIQFKISDCILNMLNHDNSPDLICNELIKQIESKISGRNIKSTAAEVEILTYIVKFHGKNLKPQYISDLIIQYKSIFEKNVKSQNFPYDIYIHLLIVLNQFAPPELHVKPEFFKIEEAHENTSKLLSLFNLETSKISSKELIKAINSLGKEKSIIALKLIGKIISKASLLLPKSDPIIAVYDQVFEELISQTDFFSEVDPENSVIDANLIIFIITIGYCDTYENKPDTYHNVLNFVITLISQEEIDSQLILNALTLLVFKKVTLKPDKELLISELDSLQIDDEKIETAKSFFKKVYYLLK